MTYSKPSKVILLNGIDGSKRSSVYLSVSKEFDGTLSALPSSSASRVGVPHGAAKRRAFFAKLANTNMARIAAGGMAMVLVLVQADSAQAQSASISVAGIEGVVSVVVQADGSALATLANGSTVSLPAGSFIQTASGDILVPDATADQIAASVESAAAGGGLSAGLVAIPVGVLAAAGGGGSSSSAAPAADGGALDVASGRVIDGYLVDATVFRDLNGDGVLQVGEEPSTQTDEAGNYSLAIDAGNPDANLVSFGGTDSSTGEAFTGVLTAPSGSNVVTPLTTLVQSYVEAQAANGTPVDAESAASQLATALGLDGQNLLDLDPVAEIEMADGSADAFQAAAQVASIINAAAASADNAADASAAVAGSLAEELLEAGDGGDGTSALSDVDVINEALADAGVTGDEAGAIGTAVQEANALIEAAGTAAEGEVPPTIQQIQEQVERVQEVVQGDLVEEIQSEGGNVGEIAVADRVEAIVSLRPVVEEATTIVGPEGLEDGLTVSGTGRPDSTVSVTIDGVDVSAVVGIASADGTGLWSVEFTQADLPDASGVYEITTRASSQGSDVFTTAVSSGTLTIDLTAPEVEFTDFPIDAVTLVDQNDGITVEGTTESGAAVTVTLDGVEADAVVDGDGAFTATFAAVANTGQTSFEVSAVATDALGNASEAQTATLPLQPVSALAPTIDAVPENLNIADVVDGFTISGTGLAGSVVALEIAVAGSEAVYASEITVDENGAWSQLVPAAAVSELASGDYAVSATANLLDGAITSSSVAAGSIAIDVTAPEAAVGVSVSEDNQLQLEERDAPINVSGSAELGSTVDISLGTETTTASVGTDGSFSVDFAAADVPAGDEATITTVVTDAAGNEGPQSSTVLNIESVSALIPTVQQVSQTLGQAGLEAGIAVSGTGREGSTVTVTINGTEKTATITEGASDWSVTFDSSDLPDESGSFPVSVRAALPGTSLETGVISGGTLTIDLTAPSGPVIDAIASDDILDAIEARADLIVTGTAVAGTTVTVSLGGVSREVSADSGTFTATFTASEISDLPASSAIAAFSTDSLNNVSATTTRSFAVSSPIVGTEFGDGLVGTDGNDLFLLRTEGTTVGSAGDDEYDFSDEDVGYQVLDYSGFSQGINANIDLTLDENSEVNGSSVTKGTLGTDTLVDLRGTFEGLALATTEHDDTISIKQSDNPDAFTSIWYEGGNDTINVDLNEGITRISFDNDGEVFVDLEAGTALYDFGIDGSGIVEINVTPTTSNDARGRIEIEGSDGIDMLLGSDLDERFIGRGGNDFIDGGDGIDLARYDRFQIDAGVFVDLHEDDGIAVGTWNGESFVHFLNGIEDVDGSDGNDLIIANDLGSRLEGGDGNDFLIGERGNDQFIGGNGADVFFTDFGSDYIDDFEIGVDKLEISEGFFGTDPDIEWTFSTSDSGYAQMSRTIFDNSSESEQVITFGNGVQAADLEAAFNAGILFYETPETTNDLIGTAGDDLLIGTDQNDYIDVIGGDDFTFDQVIGSAGSDFIDLSNATFGSFVQFYYGEKTDNGIVGEFDLTGGDESVGLIFKIGDGIDTFDNLQAAGDGIDLVGTQNSDFITFQYDADDFQWVNYSSNGGDDFVEVVNGNGTLRLSIGRDGDAVTGDLGNGFIDAGEGGTISLERLSSFESADNGIETQIELRTFSGDDNISGSDGDDRFILGTGQDTVDGRDGFDLIRYDRFGIDGVVVDLGEGTATGAEHDVAFNHSLTSIEGVRGSVGDDILIGDDEDNFISGRGGNDTLAGGGGSDFFEISLGNTVILDFDLALDDIQARSDISDDLVFETVDYEGQAATRVTDRQNDGANVTFVGLDAADVQAFLEGPDQTSDPAGSLFSPSDLDNPIVLNASGQIEFDPFVSLVTNGVPQETSATEVKLGSFIDGVTYHASFTGQDLALTDGVLSSGDLTSLRVTVDGAEVLDFDNIGVSVPEFIEFLSGENGLDREVILVGSDGNDDVASPSSLRSFIFAGDGDDDIFADTGNSDVSIVPGDGNDSIFLQPDEAEDQNFIFIDQENDTGTDLIDGFRITNSGDTGDLLILVGGSDSRTHFNFVSDVSDADALNDSIGDISGFLGNDSNVVLFFEENSDNAALYEVESSGEIGDEVAIFNDLDTSDWDISADGAFSNIVLFTDELPQLPEVS